MVGNAGESSPSADEAQPKEAAQPVKPLARTFSCPSCGAAITIRYPGAAMSATCESCYSVIDTSDNNYKILTRYFTKTALYSSNIELGSRGKLGGKTWEMIGYMVRSDGTSRYHWEEYLLFNPYYGYRWLTNDHGHWSFVRTVKEKPQSQAGGVSFSGKDYKVFNRGVAKVEFVLGEFYWRVVVGNQVSMADYICPPEMLSREGDKRETVWSVSEYLEPEQVKEAFKLKRPLAPTIGTAPNQPSRYLSDWKKVLPLWLGFIAILSCIQMVTAVTASNKLVFESAYSFTPGVKTNDLTTAVFTLDNPLANVKIDFLAPVDNSWLYVSGELVNNSDGTSYPFERSMEYYHGWDSDGSWSEGGNSNSLLLAAVPAGQYYLNMDTENGDFKDRIPRQFSISVTRGVPTYANYFWCMFFVSVIPGLAWWMMRSVESSRWSNSDYSPYPQLGG